MLSTRRFSRKIISYPSVSTNLLLKHVLHFLLHLPLSHPPPSRLSDCLEGINRTKREKSETIIVKNHQKRRQTERQFRDRFHFISFPRQRFFLKRLNTCNLDWFHGFIKKYKATTTQRGKSH